MNAGIDLIADLLRSKQDELDEIEWEDPRDPRIEGLLRQIRDYEDKLNKGEIYEPDF
tara:strand:- start:1404 stop:1574 length:171 start_codon:yes stop_codon:yes gene_type:complete